LSGLLLLLLLLLCLDCFACAFLVVSQLTTHA
jgi:hypothetical protein